MATDYEDYILSEWTQFLEDPTRPRALLDAVADRPAARVLDVGCGAGQELIPFAQRGECCIGVDVARPLGRVPWRAEHGSVTFVRGRGEQLPFGAGAFDVVICRGALPAMHNRQALGEMARVLRPGGLLLLTVVAAPFYLRELRRGLSRGDARPCVHAVHVLLGGALYHLLGVQVRTPITRATFQSEWMLRRELGRLGLRIVMRLPHSNRIAPSFGIEKPGAARDGPGPGEAPPRQAPRAGTSGGRFNSSSRR
jgi:SAM-dependent methyltransferase